MVKTVHAAVKCSVCGRLINGAPVVLPEVNLRRCNAEEAEEILRKAVKGLMQAHGNDLRCPDCGTGIFQRNAKMALVYQDVDGTVH